MAWLAVDVCGYEYVFDEYPNYEYESEYTNGVRTSQRIRLIVEKYDDYHGCEHIDAVELPEGSIKKLIGRKLTWADCAVEIK